MSITTLVKERNGTRMWMAGSYSDLLLLNPLSHFWISTYVPKFMAFSV